MTFFRTVKKESPFVQIDKELVNDNKISAKAKGIMMYLLSKPDGWKIYEKDIVNHMKDGKDSISSGIKELVDRGYIHRELDKQNDGKFSGYNYTVYETVEDNPHRENRIGKTDNGKTDNGKPATINNNLSNNDLNNIELNNINTLVPTNVDDTKVKKSKYKYSDEDMVLSKLLFQYIRNLDAKAKEPNFEYWANAVRLMREVDKRSYEEIKEVIIWCQNDDFWQGNILSTTKLRQQFSKLLIRMNKERGAASGQQSWQQAPRSANQDKVARESKNSGFYW